VNFLARSVAAGVKFSLDLKALLSFGGMEVLAWLVGILLSVSSDWDVELVECSRE
jgi:hypothetical protein